MSLPATIIYPKAFQESLPPGFDGVVEWQWMIDIEKMVSPKSRITPTDIDIAVERKGHILFFETKEMGVKVGFGQLELLRVATGNKQRAVILWGSKDSKVQNWQRWAHRFDGRWSKASSCSNDDVHHFYEAWRRCAEHGDMGPLRDVYRHLKIRCRARAVAHKFKQVDLFHKDGT